eukprot:Pgem_evm1s16729
MGDSNRTTFREKPTCKTDSKLSNFFSRFKSSSNEENGIKNLIEEDGGVYA